MIHEIDHPSHLIIKSSTGEGFDEHYYENPVFSDSEKTKKSMHSHAFPKKKLLSLNNNASKYGISCQNN